MDDMNSLQSTKRSARSQRVAAACDECRNRKIKCDGQRPVCSPCIGKGKGLRTCTWGLRKGRGAGVSLAEFKRLKRRIDELEGSLGPEAMASPQQIQSRRETESADASISLDNIVDAENESMTMMGLLEDASPSQISADSSASNFFNRIRNFISSNNNQKTQTTSPRHSTRRPSAQRPSTWKRRSCPDDDVLPSRHRADYLLNCYWEREVYPFVDSEAVEGLYPKLWTGENIDTSRQTFLCLVNMMFSVACLRDPLAAPSERAENAELYYQRARNYVDIELLNSRSPLAVQCFLLFGEYLQSTNEPQWCWTFVGLAIRIAQSLGFDSPCVDRSDQSLREREKMRSIWHSCVIMDRGLEMTFGRPAMITPQAASSATYPMAHIEGDTCACFDDASAPNPSAPVHHFFIEALKLYEVMHEMWQLLYGPALNEPADDAFTEYFDRNGAKAVGTIAEIYAKLRSLEQKLPHYLQHTSNLTKAIKHQRQTNVLWLRHRHVRLLLFRPVLARFCDPSKAAAAPDNQSLPWQMALQCSLSCVRTALETINFLDEIISNKELGELDDLLPGWWYSILYIYSAAAVLLAARLHPNIVTEISERVIADGWQRALKILKRFACLNSYASTCAESLNRLFKKVRQHYSDVQQSENSSQQPRPRPRPQYVHNNTPRGSTEQGIGTSHVQSDMNNSLVWTHEAAVDSRPMPDYGGNVANASQSSSTPEAVRWDGGGYVADSGIDMTTSYYFGVDSIDLPDDMSWLTAFPYQLYESELGE